MAKAHIHLRNGRIIECDSMGKTLDNETIFKDLKKQGIDRSQVKKIVHKIK